MKTCPKCKGTGRVPGESLEDSVHRRYLDAVTRQADPAPHSVGASLTIGGQRWAWVFAGLPNHCTRCGGRQEGCSWWWVAVDRGEVRIIGDRIIGRMCDDCMQATTQDDT